MNFLKKILIDFELHNVEGITECFKNGVNPNEIVNGKPLIYALINMYSRGPRFKRCIQAFVDNGLVFEDKILLAVLLDDSDLLENYLRIDKKIIEKLYTLSCTFTPLYEATLLHICAEYNHISCAEILLKYGADVNAKAGLDDYGFGGHTAIFHTVNQHENKCIEMLKLLLANNADLSLTIKGLIWGQGYDWETFIPSVNPISYAMMGLLRQFQRSEKQIYEVVALLFKTYYGIDYTPGNIPNKYLN